MLEEERKSKLSHPSPPQTGWISRRSPRSSRGGAARAPGSDGAVPEPAGPAARRAQRSPAAEHGRVPREKGNGAGLLRAVAGRSDGESSISSRGAGSAPRVQAADGSEGLQGRDPLWVWVQLIRAGLSNSI